MGGSLDIDLTREEENALKSIESPMLRNYIISMYRDLKKRGHNTPLLQVLESSGLEKYARNIGASPQLEEAREKIIRHI